MSEIISDIGLRDAIMLLESRRKEQELELRQQLKLTYESVKPINLIKSTYEEVVASQGLKDNLVNTSVGLAAGYISKTLFEGVSHSPLRKLFGTALLFGITNAVRKNPDVVKSVVRSAFRIIRSGVALSHAVHKPAANNTHDH